MLPLEVPPERLPAEVLRAKPALLEVGLVLQLAVLDHALVTLLLAANGALAEHGALLRLWSRG